MCGHVLLVFFDSVLAWVTDVLTCAISSSNPVSPSSVSSSSVSPCNSTSVSSLIAPSALSHPGCFSQRSPNCGLTVSVRLDLSSRRQKFGLLQSSVTRFLCALPSATRLIASTAMGLFMIYASSCPMNRLFLALMMWDADTKSLLTSATCHVLL